MKFCALQEFNNEIFENILPLNQKIPQFNIVNRSIQNQASDKPTKINIIPTEELINEDDCSSIKDSSKIKSYIRNELSKLELSVAKFNDTFLQLHLDNVSEIFLAKYHIIKYNKFEDWKSNFFVGL